MNQISAEGLKSGVTVDGRWHDSTQGTRLCDILIFHIAQRVGMMMESMPIFASMMVEIGV